jgi:hypothetical protein
MLDWVFWLFVTCPVVYLAIMLFFIFRGLRRPSPTYYANSVSQADAVDEASTAATICANVVAGMTHQ